MPVSIALVEDILELRQRLAERLRFFDEVRLVLVAGSAEALLQEFEARPKADLPEVILMDIELPGMSGVEATALVRQRYPDLEVMMLTVFEDEDRIFAAIQAGASGYLLKDVSTETLVQQILELRGGGAPMSPPVARKMLRFVQQEHTAPAMVRPPAFELSEREMEILRGIVRDETEASIAEALFISPHTVRTHIKNIYKKLHVHSRASAVRLALEKRLV